MQTFLIGTFRETAAKLDNKRLFKQLLEGKQILDVIVNKKKAWSNHPAVRQWKNHPSFLFVYLVNIFNELQSRKIAPNTELFNQCCELIKLNGIKDYSPEWVNRADIRSSHRSRLLCKGFIDAICVDLKRDLKIKKVDKWLKEKYGKTKNQLRYDDGLKIKNDFPQVNFSTPNFYEQYGWTDDIRADYIWPV